MNYSLAHVKQIKKEFKKELERLFPDYDRYYFAIGISTVGLRDPSIETTAPVEYCIAVNYGIPITASIVLPNEFQGVRIYYTFVGPIVPLAS